MSDELSLQVMEKGDLLFFYKLCNNNEIMKFWFEEPYYSMDKLEEDYMRNVRSEGVRQFIIKKGTERIGYIGFYGLERIHRKAEFGIMIDPEKQGNGYAITATKLAIDYAFSTLNLNKLYLIVDEVNEKAIHIYKKAGFKVEGTLKDEYFIDGSYHNVVYMSIFQKDYFNK